VTYLLRSLLCSIVLHPRLHPRTWTSRELLELFLGQLCHLKGLVLGGDMPALLEPGPFKQGIEPLLEVWEFVDVHSRPFFKEEQ
jgi:hypothetical protein